MSYVNTVCIICQSLINVSWDTVYETALSSENMRNLMNMTSDTNFPDILGSMRISISKDWLSMVLLQHVGYNAVVASLEYTLTHPS